MSYSEVWGEKLHQTPELEPGLYMCGNKVLMQSTGQIGEVVGVDEENDKYEIELDSGKHVSLQFLCVLCFLTYFV